MKLSKAEVDYRRAQAPVRHCGNCSMYRPSAANRSEGSCTLVAGNIEGEMVCDRWAGKR